MIQNNKEKIETYKNYLKEIKYNPLDITVQQLNELLEINNDNKKAI